MVIYGLKNCDTCRKASKALGVPVTDMREIPMEDALLAQVLEVFGAAAVNTRSTTWRGLDEVARAEPPEALLRANPALMKRPVITHEGQLYMGWTSQVRAALGVD